MSHRLSHFKLKEDSSGEDHLDHNILFPKMYLLLKVLTNDCCRQLVGL